MEFGGSVAGFGAGGKPDFWISEGPIAPIHVAIASADRLTVDAFHEAALAAGGATTGLPDRDPNITRITTARSSSIRMGTTSKRSATLRASGSRCPRS
jgi:hypothetical protein